MKEKSPFVDERDLKLLCRAVLSLYSAFRYFFSYTSMSSWVSHSSHRSSAAMAAMGWPWSRIPWRRVVMSRRSRGFGKGLFMASVGHTTNPKSWCNRLRPEDRACTRLSRHQKRCQITHLLFHNALHTAAYTKPPVF